MTATIGHHRIAGSGPFPNRFARTFRQPRQHRLRRIATGVLAGAPMMVRLMLALAGAEASAASDGLQQTEIEGGWKINGSKIFITHAGVGEIFADDPDSELSSRRSVWLGDARPAAARGAT